MFCLAMFANAAKIEDVFGAGPLVGATSGTFDGGGPVGVVLLTSTTTIETG